MKEDSNTSPDSFHRSERVKVKTEVNTVHEPMEAIGWMVPLMDAVCAIAVSKWIVVTIVFVGLLLGLTRFVILPKQYTASAVAVLLPREKPSLDITVDTSSVETGDDRAGKSATGSLMLPANPALYTTLIKSRSIISQIARKYGDELRSHLLENDRSDEVVNQLKSMIELSSTEEGLITVSVTSENAALSAKIANELFEECRRASKAIERELLLKQANHMQEAYQNASRRLVWTEAELMRFTSEKGLIDPNLQASNQLRSIRELVAKRDEANSDLNEALLSYSEKSYEVKKLRSRIDSLEEMQSEARSRIVGTIGEGDYGQLLVQHENLKQKVRFERDLVLALGTKADIYRIRAEQPIGNLVVVRSALAPERPAGPSKKREFGIFLGLSIFMAVAWALLRMQIIRALENEYIRSKFSELKSHMNFKPASEIS